jgi:adenylate kinase
VLVGPPGSKRKEIALGLSAHFSEEGKDFQCISVGDLITR